MIAAFSEWIKNIIYVVLFASFLELLLPNNTMQRFIRVIMGLFIMLAILNPVIDIIQNKFMTNQVPAISSNLDNSPTILNSTNNVLAEKEKLSADIYKKQLAQQMTAMILAIDGVADAKVTLEVNNAISGNLANVVKGVVIYIKPGINTSNNQVKKVSINSTVATTEDCSLELKNKIKSMLVELYQIPKEIIDIKLLY